MRRSTLWLVLLTLLAAMIPAPGQAQLVYTLSANAISQDMQAGNAGKARRGAAENEATGEAASAASDSVGIGGVKYVPAYAIVLMLVGLSGFLVCRPSRRHEAD